MNQYNWRKPVLLVIVGLTASGKSQLAFNLANQLNGEIINADSVIIRKHLNIGADKPDQHFLKKIKHHLISEVELGEKFSVLDYQKRAKQIILDIQRRQKLPILVGGSNLYINSVVYDYSFVDHSNFNNLNLEQLSRDELIEFALKQHYDLRLVDQLNKVRLINFIKNNGQIGTRKNITNNTLIIGIKYDINKLKSRIMKRIEEMIEKGLEDEVIKIKNFYSSRLNIIGYKEWDDYFIGQESLAEVKEKIAKNTFILMKKQITWLKKNKDIYWININSNMEDIVYFITTTLNK